ncbi:MAG TPA: tRNA 2-thiouridine(34) synthase MnmA [Gemmatimonadaceae bacterium]|nr:tRNA 2-thiouridine(34) synthase MnmA [Gemmatimonadaceae bacterium]
MPLSPASPPSRTRVLAAMSGGVDSSVAAALLVRQGYDVVGVTMKLFNDGGDLPDRPCCSLDSVNDARRVCESLGIPHYVLNLQDAFGRDVVSDFVAEYAAGRTPIPCVRCNTFTKFRDLLAKADAIEAPFIATGHYARIVDGRLARGVDDNKDQTYFLWGIEREVVARMLLPVGHLTKPETRAIARELGLLTAEKPESHEICFVPDGDYVKVLERELPPDAPALQPGPIVTLDGRVIGEHEGFARYTIGQRRGLPGGSREPLFVVALRPEERAVVIGPREALLGRSVHAGEVNWLAPAIPAEGREVLVRIRHRATPMPGTVLHADATGFAVALHEPAYAISPGQSVVLYDADGLVLGGGIIAPSRRVLPIQAA